MKQKLIKIIFVSNAHKNLFLKENGFTKKELIESNTASIIIANDGTTWIKNHCVYSVHLV